MAKGTSLSARVQHRIDDMFMPSSIKKQVAEIKELRRIGKFEFADKPLPKNNSGGGGGGGGKNGSNDNAKKSGEKAEASALTEETPANFTEAQDGVIIDMKLKDKPWKEIAIEVGKTEGQCKNRFKEIKPADFDAKQAEAKKQAGEEKARAKAEKNKGKKELAGHVNAGNRNQGNQNGGKNKGQQGNNDQDDKKDEERGGGETEEGAGGEGGEVSYAGTWAVPDENFNQREITALEKIVAIEFRNAFVRIAKSFAAHKDGRRLHPDSIATKVLGEPMDMSSIGED